MFVHLTYLVLSYGTLSYEIFCGSFLIKNLVILCVQQQKNEFYSSTTGTEEVVGGKHNALVYYVDVSSPNLFGAVLCNPFK
jgi:hypothetical protein